MLKSKQLLDVISFQSKNFLIFIVFQHKHLVLLVFNLLLEEHVEFGRLHQAESQVSWDDDIHDVYLLDNHTVWVEFSLQIVFELGCELSFDITDPLDLDLLQEISDALIALLR